MMNRFAVYVAILSVIVLVSAGNRAVCQEPASAKAEKLLEKAILFYNQGNWNACLEELNKTIRTDSLIAEAYIMKGDVLMETNKNEEAILNYKKALTLKPDREETLLFVLANALFTSENYKEATVYYNKLMSLPGIDEEFRKDVADKLELSVFRNNLIEHPVEFQPVNIGKEINTPADEYINAISADGEVIYFTRKMKGIPGQGRKYFEDLYYAVRSADSVSEASLLPYPARMENDAGSFCISPDGRLLFFTACYRPDSYGSCDLYYSERKGNSWSEARNMGSTVNSVGWDAQPSISPDGSTLYFASNRPGGEGSSDIWKSEKNRVGNWSRPVNLGKPVNGSNAEMAPFIHFDNQSLYFSSKSHPGMGGADLFKSVRTGNSWSEPLNLGYPLNTIADDLVIILDAQGRQGLVSSNNKEGFGGYDIYSFLADTSIRPVTVTYLKGKVYDSQTYASLKAEFKLFDTGLDSLIIAAGSDELTGEFFVCIPANRNYALNVSCVGYLFYSENFPLNEPKTRLDPYLKNIPLDPVQAGNKMILRNIFFDKDQSVLKPESYAEMQKLAGFLIDNPRLHIEIGGHTDSDGVEAYNLDLSSKRAAAVYNYLIDKGIDKSRMTFTGYGETRPCDTNNTESGKANNRRTEVTILEIK